MIRHPEIRRYLHGVALSVVLTLSGTAPCNARAVSFILPPNGDTVIGSMQEVAARKEDTLLDLARLYNLGYEEIRIANPGVDTWVPGAGTPILLPTSFILPDAPRIGIVLNIAELRLYYYPTPRAGEAPSVITHPVGIGRYDWKTPLGSTRIASKVTNPTWYPPASIRDEHAARGDYLPEAIPPGPDNPLGEHALRLALPGYLIHGTNKPYGIGMRATHGCVRMYPEDIAALFGTVPVGTPVRIIDQPIKTGSRDGVLFVESHPRFINDRIEVPADLTASVRQIIAMTPNTATIDIDWKRLADGVSLSEGIPLPVSSPLLHAPPRPGISSDADLAPDSDGQAVP